MTFCGLLFPNINIGKSTKARFRNELFIWQKEIRGRKATDLPKLARSTRINGMEERYYLGAGRAGDLPNAGERRIYRALEMLPGVFVWGTLGILLLGSWLTPAWVAIFVIGFDIYWLFKTLYLSLHLRSSYQQMKRYREKDWIYTLRQLPVSRYSLPVTSWREVYHLIIFPMYREPIEVVRPAFDALAATDYPKERMIVVLAVEERGGEDATRVARAIEKDFGGLFFEFMTTYHPSGLEGEVAGKGSNEAWAGKIVKEKIIDARHIPYEHVAVSVFDVDTVVSPRYFSCLTYHYLTVENPTRTSFQPIPLFINNIWEAPALARVIAFSSTFWHMMNQARPEKKVTFSSHSMSFKALVDIGFWQKNVVSEDSRIFWQCFLFYDGDYRVEPLYCPVSMDANVAKSFWGTMKQLYLQQRRWAYGAGDIPYYLFGFWKNWQYARKGRAKKIPLHKIYNYGFYTFEGFWSWGTNALIILIFGFLPLFLGGEEFNLTILSYNLPRITRILLTLAMVGIISSAYTAILLLPPRPPRYGRWHILIQILQWFLVPVNMVVFGAFPAIEAMTRLMLGKYLGFWFTPKIRKE